MSHFTVMVIGSNVDEQLASFDENMEVSPYRKIMDEASILRMAKHYKLIEDNEILPKEDYKKLLPFMEDWNGREGYIDEDGNIYILNTYNPNSKWDWYQVGGRWTGFLKLKKNANGILGKPGILTEPGKEGYADQAFKKDIDIDGMRKEAEEKASQEYKKVENLFPDKKIPKIITWKEYIEKVESKEMNIEEAREQYHNQDAIKIISKSDNHFIDLDDFQVSYEEYILQAKNSAIITFAVVHNGKWYEIGEMGWWACVSNEKDKTEWDKEFNKLFDSVPEDELITIVDCHI